MGVPSLRVNTGARRTIRAAFGAARTVAACLPAAKLRYRVANRRHILTSSFAARDPLRTCAVFVPALRAWHLLNQFRRSALWSPPAWSVARRVVRCAQSSGTANRPYDGTSLLHRDPANPP